MFRRRPKTFRSSPVSRAQQREANLRQGGVPGFSHSAYQNAHIGLVGSGGLGVPVAIGAVRKGLGTVSLFDDDIYEWSNMSRIDMSRSDVGKYKAHRLGRRLASTALFPFTTHAYPWRFQEFLVRRPKHKPFDLIIGGVDNNPSRRAITLYGKEHGVPIIHTAVSRDGNSLYVFVQEHGPCWGCAMPHYVNDTTYPCGVPAIVDVLNVASGLVLFAADTIICDRQREWNFRQVYLDGGLPDRVLTVERNPDCPICNAASAQSPTAELRSADLQEVQP